jgi:hypothetical protein
VDAADLDGDGDQDVVCSSWNGEAAWFPNTDGLGSFGPGHVISTNGIYSEDVIATDLDGDGDQDVLWLARSHGHHLLVWHENIDGAGNFGPEQVIDDGASRPKSICAVDLDQDGDQDVLCVTWWPYELAWYPNADGAGTFTTRQIIDTLGGIPYVVIAADVDGDGDQDVIVGVSQRIKFYENLLEGGAFGAPQTITTALWVPRSMCAADLDGDGDQDLLSLSEHPQEVDKLAWYQNIGGSRTFGPQRPIYVDETLPTSVAAADLDGDGDGDALAASRLPPAIAWYENNGIAGTSFRSAGTNPYSYLATTSPVLGDHYTATVDLGATTGHAFALVLGYLSPLTLTLSGGQTLLVNLADPGGELLHLQPKAGPFVTYSVAVPVDPSFAGLIVYTQALHFGALESFALSNAQDLYLGY